MLFHLRVFTNGAFHHSIFGCVYPGSKKDIPLERSRRHEHNATSLSRTGLESRGPGGKEQERRYVSDSCVMFVTSTFFRS